MTNPRPIIRTIEATRPATPADGALAMHYGYVRTFVPAPDVVCPVYARRFDLRSDNLPIHAVNGTPVR